MRFPRRLEGSIDVAGGHREDKDRARRRGGRGLVRQDGRVDAWARVRPRKRDGDRGYAVKQGVAQEGGYGQRGSERGEERRGEERSGEERRDER